MKEARVSEPAVEARVRYDAANAGDVIAFWEMALSHRGAEELRAKRGPAPKVEMDRKEQIALRIDADVFSWCRGLGTGWQIRMNAAFNPTVTRRLDRRFSAPRLSTSVLPTLPDSVFSILPIRVGKFADARASITN